MKPDPSKAALVVAVLALGVALGGALRTEKVEADVVASCHELLERLERLVDRWERPEETTAEPADESAGKPPSWQALMSVPPVRGRVLQVEAGRVTLVLTDNPSSAPPESLEGGLIAVFSEERATRGM